MKPLRIGVNALYLIPGGVGGTEIYLRSLLQALAEIDASNEYVIFTGREAGVELTPAQPNFSHAPLPVRSVHRPARLLSEQALLPGTAAARKIDVLLNPGFTAPLVSPCPQVTVFHDLQHKRHPEHFRWFELPFWRLFLFSSACVSEALIAVSEATAVDLERFYPIDRTRIRVIPHGVDARFFQIGCRRLAEAPEPYLLCVSTLHPHKNLERLVAAFAEFRRRRPEFRLIIAGLRGFHTKAVEERIAAEGLEESVQITGWIDREELYGLYARAWAFVYPSTFEGFGMPVSEALAAGIPTACSSIEPLAGIVGKAALLFPPQDTGSMVEAMLRVAGDDDLRRILTAAGPERARQFCWQRAARQTLDTLQHVCSSGVR